MHRLVVLALVMVLARSAHADFTPLPRRSVALTLFIHGSEDAGINEGGIGPNLELALGRHRRQYFAELALSGFHASTNDGTSGFGMHARLGGGIRWIARSFDADDSPIDLILEAFAGVEHMQWTGGHLTRPDAGVGVGWQVRFGRRAVRFVTRVYVRPPSDEPAMTAVCRGACPEVAAMPNIGFMGLIGYQW